MPSIGHVRFVAVATLLFVAACSSDNPTPITAADPPPEVDENLLSDCMAWPEQPFGLDNRTTIRTLMEPGDAYVDFELRDGDGNPVRLSKLLDSKPVLLILGNYTCPRYQDNIPILNRLYHESYDASSTFGDRFHFVHVYIVEAHPKAPDASPYSGVVSELFYSEYLQAKTYEQRKLPAAAMAAQFQGNQLMLIDDLDPEGRVNPVWCTYGTAPNATYLIDQDGLIRSAMNYSFGNLLEPEMRSMIAELDE